MPSPPPVNAVCRSLGSRVALADLLGVDRGVVEAWLSGAAEPTASQARRIRDLETLLAHVRRLERNEIARAWLRSPSPMLDGALPLDVVLVDGPDRVLEAFEREVPAER